MLKAASALFDRLKLEFLGNRGEHVEVPRQVLTIRAGRHFQLDEVPDGGGDRGLVALEVGRIPRLPFLGELAQLFGEGAGEVGRDGRFLGDN